MGASSDHPLAVAIGSTSYAHPEHFAGLSTVILALDGDAAGQEGRRRLWLELTGRGIALLSLPASALDGGKDLGEYWQTHRTMPAQLMARAIGPHLQSVTPSTTPNRPNVPPEKDATPAADTIAQGDDVEPSLELAFDDLPAELRAEAEALAVWLGGDTSGDLYTDFVHDLDRNRATLSAEDVVAAEHAVNVASRLIVARSSA